MSGQPSGISCPQENEPHKGHAREFFAPGDGCRQRVRLKNRDIFRKNEGCAENQPEHNLQKKQTYKKHQQDLADIAFKIVQKLKQGSGFHKRLRNWAINLPGKCRADLLRFIVQGLSILYQLQPCHRRCRRTSAILSPWQFLTTRLHLRLRCISHPLQSCSVLLPQTW